MAARLRGDNMVVVGYMGDGATSEGDFHVALNFAGVFRAPVVFVCQNNQWAISTPVGGQTASATMAQKALAYRHSGATGRWQRRAGLLQRDARCGGTCPGRSGADVCGGADFSR